MNNTEEVPTECKECPFFEFETREKSYCKDKSQIRGTKRVLHKPFDIPSWCKFFDKREGMDG